LFGFIFFGRMPDKAAAFLMPGSRSHRLSQMLASRTADGKGCFQAENSVPYVAKKTV
jgi:hypothetical protein